MRAIEFEARRNPELNPKIKPTDIIKKYAGDPNVYISYTNLPKLGINPNPASINTPAAVYAYPLDIVYNDIKKDITNVPFAGNSKYLYIFKYNGTVLDVSKFNKNDLKKSMRRLHGNIIGRFKELPYYELDGPGHFMPFRGLMDYVRKLSLEKKGLSDLDFAGPKTDPNRKYPKEYSFTFNKMLRNATGYDAFVDPNFGIIHGGEPAQAMFLNPSKIQVLDMLKLK